MPHKKPVQDEIRKRGTKLCGRCKRHRKVKFFAKRKNTLCGLSSWCKGCNRAYDNENRAQFRRRRKKQYYLRQHGVSLEVFEKQVRKQKRRCAICSRWMKEPHLDHNPVTGKMRSALCHKCNVGLGHFNDSTKLLRKALKYLERHK